MEQESDKMTASGLTFFESLTGNVVSQISQLHIAQNKRDYGDVNKKQALALSQKKERHIGNIFDLQSMELAAAMKRMVESLDLFVDLYEAVLDLFYLKDPYKSTFFLVATSLAILHLELAVAIGLLCILLFIQYNAYYRRIYEPPRITIVRNAQFVLVLIAIITDAADFIELFSRNVLYWGKPNQSVLMMNVAFFGCFIAYFSLSYLPLRPIIVIALWISALRNSEFFTTLGLSALHRVKRIDYNQFMAGAQ